MKNRVIVTDYDGCLGDWQSAFDTWMANEGYTVAIPDHIGEYRIGKQYNIPEIEAMQRVGEFNNSGAIAGIPALRDARQYINTLHYLHGYVFHCITSLSKEEYAYRQREENLQELFGSTAFERLTCLDTGADKKEALLEYEGSGCFFVEDNVNNAEIGAELGLNPIVIAHGYNETCTKFPRVHTWREIYEIIIN